MVSGAADDVRDPDDRLAESRAQFVESLGVRLSVLQEAFEDLHATPASAGKRVNFLRRVHAMGVAAEALGFNEAYAALFKIEQLLPESAAGIEASVEEIVRLLDVIPSLVLGGKAPASQPLPKLEAPAPLSVVFFGLAPLAQGIRRHQKSWEIRIGATAEKIHQLIHTTSPDAVVIDRDEPHALDLVESVARARPEEPLRLVVIGSFDRPEAAATFLHAGVDRVLPKPVSPQTLERHLSELCSEAAVRRFTVAPLGDLTLPELLQRIQLELNRGIAESVTPAARDAVINFGDGVEELAAIWGAVARLRELVSLRSGGAVSFDVNGPEGAVGLVPWGGSERHVSTSPTRNDTTVALNGRRIIVADDDPAVLWFIAGVLREAGAEVIEAHDGKRALDLAFQVWPDLIISDLLMPEIDGFELCRRLKRDIALHDVPIILLSWKEDLLLRVRELGAHADGYLQKEASGSAIVRSAGDVLRTRSRIEERFKKNPEVQGRLDTVTPRLILELCCKLLGNASVSFRDAAFLYEVEVRKGQLISAVRTDNSGVSEQGPELMGPLLGVRAGRFAAQRSSREIVPLFEGSLEDLTADALKRARALQALLVAPAINRVECLDISRARVEPYLAVSPIKIRALVERLLLGEAPARLILEHGEQVVEAALFDLAVHDGISQAYDAQGEPLLASRPGAVNLPRSDLESVGGEIRASSGVPSAIDESAAAIAGPTSDLGVVAPQAPIEPRPDKKPQNFEILPRLDDSTATAKAPGWGAMMRQASVASSRPNAVPNVSPAVAELAALPAESRESSVASNAGSSLGETHIKVNDAASDGDAVLDSLTNPEDEDRVGVGRPRSDGEMDPEVRPVLAPGHKSTFADPAVSSVDEQFSPGLPPEIYGEPGSDISQTRISEAPRTQDPESSKAHVEAKLAAVKDRSRSAASTTSSKSRYGIGKLAAFALAGVCVVGLGVWVLQPTSEEEADSAAAPASAGVGSPPASIVSATVGNPGGNNESKQPATSQPAPQAMTSQAAAPAIAAFQVQDLELPADVMVAAGKGLLEVNTAEKYRIYVDGVFVGPGPIRTVPLSAGQHEVKVKLDGQERQTSVEVKVGRRARLDNVGASSK